MYKFKICVLGIGGCGCNILNRIMVQRIPDIKYIGIDTDEQALLLSRADNKILLGDGDGCGSDPDLGKKKAMLYTNEFLMQVADANLVVMVAGLGGGTGSGAVPYFADLLKQEDKIVISLLVNPFDFEGARRAINAKNCLEFLESQKLPHILIQNENLLKSSDFYNEDMLTALAQADNIVKDFLSCLIDTCNDGTTLDVEISDFEHVLKNAGISYFGYGRSESCDKYIDATRRAVNSPLLDQNIVGASGVILMIRGDETLTFAETNQITDLVKAVVKENASIMFSAAITSEKGITVSILATGFDNDESSKKTAYRYQNLCQEAQLQNYISMQKNNRIFLSYCSKDSDIADTVDAQLRTVLDGEFIITRDVRDTEYKDSFLEFMNTIPEHNFVLMIISERYLTSANCMYEVLECMRNHNYADKILFILMDDAKIYDDDSLVRYTRFWKTKLDEVKEEIKCNAEEELIPSLSELTALWIRYNKIMMDICELIKLLKDQKGYKYQELLVKQFRPITDYLRKKKAEE